jgi:hypothetical protein
MDDAPARIVDDSCTNRSLHPPSFIDVQSHNAPLVVAEEDNKGDFKIGKAMVIDWTSLQ